MDFGIWVEPEMVNVDSELYKAHPDWAMDIPGKNHSEGRNQRLLDLSRAEVQDYIIGQMSDLFSSANIAYVKWDMNRIVTDYYSKILPPERQGEVAHRYVLGLYRCMKELTERFPEIYLRDVQQAATGLILESYRISHRSGRVMTQTHCAVRRFRPDTVTVIQCPW